MSKNNSTIASKNYTWILLVLLLIIGLFCLGYFASEFMNTETEWLPNTISSNSPNQLVEFKHAHKLTINDKEIGIGKKFDLTQDLFTQGTNKIEVKRVSKWGLEGSKKSSTIFVDTSINNVKFAKYPPEKVFNLSNIELDIAKDQGDKLLLNGSQTETAEKKINLPLKSGENKFTLQTQDNLGNSSEVEEIYIFNETNPKYKEITCDKVKFYLDSNKVQIGVSGVKDRPEVTNESDEFFAEFNQPTGKCIEANSSYSIQPLNQFAECWNCGGGITQYITLGKSSEVLNQAKVETKEINPNIIESVQEYTTETGITGSLIKSKSPLNDMLQEYKFRFTINNDEYVLSSSSIDDETMKADFVDILNSLTLVNPADDQTLKFNNDQKQQEYSFTEGEFSIQTNSDWRVERGKLDNRGDYKTETLTLSKSLYTITIDKYFNEDGGCGAVADIIPIENYQQVTIDGLELYVPQYTKIKPVQSQIGGSSVYQKNPTGDYDCVYEAGGEKYEIRVFTDNYSGQTTKVDALMEQEVNEILQSIKWK
jgi:hypothetical protein